MSLNNISVLESYDLIEERRNDFPTNYRRMLSKAETEEGVSHIIDSQQFLKNNRAIYIYNSFQGEKKYFFKQPIAVKIYQDEDLFFAENENLNVCGTGDTIQEALEDLQSHIIHFYHYYQDIRNEQLLGDAVRLKEVYCNLVIERE